MFATIFPFACKITVITETIEHSKEIQLLLKMTDINEDKTIGIIICKKDDK